MNYSDRIGEVSGMLTFLKETKSKQNRKQGIFACECGNEKEFFIGRVLNTKQFQHCGCKANCKPNLRHGMRYTPVYSVWRGIKNRCLNANNKDYKRYGGAGITMSIDWENFENFYADMGDKPNGMTIDRIDNKDGYRKENCRWATPSQQAKNKSSSYFVKINNTVYDSLYAAADGENVTAQTIVRWCDGYSDSRRKHQFNEGKHDGRPNCKRWLKY